MITAAIVAHSKAGFSLKQLGFAQALDATSFRMQNSVASSAAVFVVLDPGSKSV
jgi:hypothetical protein